MGLTLLCFMLMLGHRRDVSPLLRKLSMLALPLQMLLNSIRNVFILI